MFDLEKNGDKYEQEANKIFGKNNFPSYEIFWQKFIVQLTNRIENPKDINVTIDSKLITRFPSESIEKIH